MEIDQEILLGFIAEVQSDLELLDERFIALEKHPKDKEIIDAIFRTVHSIKGNAGFFELKTIKNFSHKIENLLDELRQHKRDVSKDIISLLLEGIDHLKALFNDLSTTISSRDLNEAEAAYVEKLASVMNQVPECLPWKLKYDSLKKICEQLTQSESFKNNEELKSFTEKFLQIESEKIKEPTAETPTEEAQESIAPKDESKSESKSDAHHSMKKTMRVEEEKIDGFMKYVGELIIASEVFNYIQKSLENLNIDNKISREFKNAILSFNELSQNLQNSLMEIRQIPIKTI